MTNTAQQHIHELQHEKLSVTAGSENSIPTEFWCSCSEWHHIDFWAGIAAERARLMATGVEVQPYIAKFPIGKKLSDCWLQFPQGEPGNLGSVGLNIREEDGQTLGMEPSKRYVVVAIPVEGSDEA